MAAKKKTKVETLPIEEEVKNEVVEGVMEPEKPLTGTVSNCSRLNVRRNPAKDAKVKCIIDSGSRVTIIDKVENNEWYKVSTEAGDFGFCMAKYITIKQ